MRYVFYAIAALLLLWSLYCLFRWIKGGVNGKGCGCGGGCGACPGRKSCRKSVNMKNT